MFNAVISCSVQGFQIRTCGHQVTPKLCISALLATNGFMANAICSTWLIMSRGCYAEEFADACRSLPKRAKFHVTTREVHLCKQPIVGVLEATEQSW